MTSYHSIFVSPHIDDVVFSCGATLAESCHEGPVLVLNVFSNSGRTAEKRKEEEKHAAQLLGYKPLFLDLPDNKRRDWLGWLPMRMKRPLHLTRDGRWIQEVSRRIGEILAPIRYERIYFPLGVGMHIDHQVCAQIGLNENPSKFILFFEEIPYALRPKRLERRLKSLQAGPAKVSFRPELRPIDDFFELKLRAIWAYESQASLFFKSVSKTRGIYMKYNCFLGAPPGRFFERFWVRLNGNGGIAPSDEQL